LSFFVSGQPLTAWVRLTDDTATTLFTATKRTTVIGMRFKEHAGGTPNLTVLRNDGTNDHYFRNAEAMTAKQEVLFDEVFVLAIGDTLKAQSNDAQGDIHCRVTYIEPSASVGGGRK
jgi:hypothetical protein